MKSVLILGAGFAGLELATMLSDEVPDEVDVTIVDSSDAFVFGFSKLDLMFGRKDLAGVRVPYSHLHKPSVRFVQETILTIDPERRRVTTNAATYEPDILVVALGADLDPAATPGMVEEGSEFYTVEGAARVSELLPAFAGGDVIIGVLGNFFKCPAAPFETAFMLHDFLEKRGLRATSTIKIVSPMGMPIPISPEASAGILEAAGERDIEWCPQSKVTALDPATKIATLEDGRTMPYALFLGIPVHRAPQVVADSALAEDGWIAVDHRTFATRFENVYAVGDVTSAPVPEGGRHRRRGSPHPGRGAHPPDQGRRGAGALPRHGDLLHRVRGRSGRPVRRQLPVGPDADRLLHGGLRGDRRIEGRVRRLPPPALVRPRLTAPDARPVHTGRVRDRRRARGHGRMSGRATKGHGCVHTRHGLKAFGALAVLCGHRDRCSCAAQGAQAATKSKTYYVSLGDSYSVGYQPGRGATPGYTVVVAKATRLTLVNFGCGGATTTSLVSSVGCPDVLPHTAGGVTYPTTTQEAAALSFLNAHRGHIGLITVSIGGNDVTACASQANPIPCVATAVAGITKNVTSLAAALRAAAGQGPADRPDLSGRDPRELRVPHPPGERRCALPGQALGGGLQVPHQPGAHQGLRVGQGEPGGCHEGDGRLRAPDPNRALPHLRHHSGRGGERLHPHVVLRPGEHPRHTKGYTLIGKLVVARYDTMRRS